MPINAVQSVFLTRYNAKHNSVRINIIFALIICAVYLFSLTVTPILAVNNYSQNYKYSSNKVFFPANSLNGKTIKNQTTNTIAIVTYITQKQISMRQIMDDKNTQFQLYTVNGRGSVINVSGNGDDLIYNYDAYGKPALERQRNNALNIVALIPNPIRYNGERFDNNTRLQYLRARFYSPDLRRFINQDSYKLLNRFNYVAANPVSHADPSGHFFGLLLMLALPMLLKSLPQDSAVGKFLNKTPTGNILMQAGIGLIMGGPVLAAVNAAAAGIQEIGAVKKKEEEASKTKGGQFLVGGLMALPWVVLNPGNLIKNAVGDFIAGGASNIAIEYTAEKISNKMYNGHNEDAVNNTINFVANIIQMATFGVISKINGSNQHEQETHNVTGANRGAIPPGAVRANNSTDRNGFNAADAAVPPGTANVNDGGIHQSSQQQPQAVTQNAAMAAAVDPASVPLPPDGLEGF